MFGKIKSGFVLAAAVGLGVACGYDYDWMKGDFEGTTKLSKIYYGSGSPPETVSSGEGRINFAFPFRPKLGISTPVPDCSLNFLSEVNEDQYYLDPSSAYKGSSNDGKGCEALMAPGVATRIEFLQGSMKREKDGEVVMKLKFIPKDSTGATQYEFEFRGRKKGWF